MLMNNNLFLYNLQIAIKHFAYFVHKLPLTPAQIKKYHDAKATLFANSYQFLHYAINALYSEKFFSTKKINVAGLWRKYEFLWKHDEQKKYYFTFLFLNLLTTIDANNFYLNFYEIMVITNQSLPVPSIKKRKKGQHYSTKVSFMELANFLMIIIYEPMVWYVAQQQTKLKAVFTNYHDEKLQTIFYNLDYYIRSIINRISKNKQYYVCSDDDNLYIKVSSITINDVKINLWYEGLRANLLFIFPQPENVILILSDNAPLNQPMFNDNDITFKSVIKLIIKNETFRAFINSIKKQDSKYMGLKYWQTKFMANIGNLILMYLSQDFWLH